MKELRDIKLDLLMGKQNPIVDLFNEITSGIKIINCNVYNEDGLEFIYHKDDQWIFYQDSKNEKFWTHYYRYWSPFEANFNLEYDEIQSITKYLVEEALKREVSTPFTSGTPLVSTPDSIINKYGNKVIIPKMLPKIEDALKREVGTPIQTITAFAALSEDKSVEKALMRNL